MGAFEVIMVKSYIIRSTGKAKRQFREMTEEKTACLMRSFKASDGQYLGELLLHRAAELQDSCTVKSLQVPVILALNRAFFQQISCWAFLKEWEKKAIYLLSKIICDDIRLPHQQEATEAFHPLHTFGHWGLLLVTPETSCLGQSLLTSFRTWCYQLNMKQPIRYLIRKRVKQHYWESKHDSAEDNTNYVCSSHPRLNLDKHTLTTSCKAV